MEKKEAVKEHCHQSFWILSLPRCGYGDFALYATGLHSQQAGHLLNIYTTYDKYSILVITMSRKPKNVAMQDMSQLWKMSDMMSEGVRCEEGDEGVCEGAFDSVYATSTLAEVFSLSRGVATCSYTSLPCSFLILARKFIVTIYIWSLHSEG